MKVNLPEVRVQVSHSTNEFTDRPKREVRVFLTLLFTLGIREFEREKAFFPSSK